MGIPVAAVPLVRWCPPGDILEFHSLFLREVYARELAVGEVGGGAATRHLGLVMLLLLSISCITPTPSTSSPTLLSSSRRSDAS